MRRLTVAGVAALTIGAVMLGAGLATISGATSATSTPGATLSLSSTASGVTCNDTNPSAPFCTGITANDPVDASGTGYSAGSLASVEECSNDPFQPAIYYLNTYIPVSCSPLKITSISATGTLAGVKSITGGTSVSACANGTNSTTCPPVGPPETGITDSCVESSSASSTTTTTYITGCTASGNDTTDAKSYPCPPSTAQLDEGIYCLLAIGDQAGDEGIGTLVWEGQSYMLGDVTTSGSSITDTSTVYGDTASGSPTGSVKYYVCQTGTTTTFTPSYCANTGTAESTETVSSGSGNTASATSAPFTPSSDGTWCFSAQYAGNSSYSESSDNISTADLDSDQCVLVTTAGTFSPTVTSSLLSSGLYPSASSYCPDGGCITQGSPVVDTATVSGNSESGSPAGSVTFYACQIGTSSATFSGGPCPATGTPVSTGTLSAGSNNESSTTSASFTPTSEGTWCFSASYGGGPDYYSSADNTSTSNSDNTHECVQVNSSSGLSASSTSSTVSSSSVTQGSSITDTATVTGNSTDGSPVGSVEFFVCQTGTSQTLTAGTCAASGVPASTVDLTTGANDESSTTSGSFTPSSAGTWCFSAVYSASDDYVTSSDNTSSADPDECVLVTPTVSPSSTSSLASSSSITLGSNVTDTATVTGNATNGSPTGSVVFYVCQTGTSQTLTTGPCAASGTPEDTETLVTGSNDTSSATSVAFAPSSEGTWCFSAVYSAGSSYEMSSDNTSASNADPNECVLVAPPPLATATVTSSVQPGTTTLGSSVTDLATVTGNSVSGSPTGSVTYYACQTGTSGTLTTGPCAASGTPEDTETLVQGSNDTSSATSVAFTPTSTGTWCFSITYSGDDNYSSSSDNTSASNEDSNECVLVTTSTTTTTLPLPTGPIGSYISASTVGLGPLGSVTDSVVVVGNATHGSPTGNVFFYVCQTGTTQTLTTGPCSPMASNHLDTTRVIAGADNTSDATSLSFTATAAGTWCFSAVYGGDNNYAAASDNTGSQNLDTNECVLVTNAPSTSASVISSASITLGPSGTVSDIVTVSGNYPSGDPTGSVAFYVCETGTTQTLTTGACAPTGTPEDTETLVPGAGYTSSATSASFTPTSAGTWCFSAVYGGDDNYSGSSDNTSSSNLDSAECVLVAQAPSSTLSTVSSPEITLGPSGTVTDTVTVSGNSAGGSPSGSVSFYVCETATTQTLTTGPCAASGTPQSTETLTTGSNDTSSVTSASLIPSSAGTWCFSAAFAGDQNYGSSSDNTSNSNADPDECLLVTQAPSTSATQVSSATITIGASGTVTDTVTVTGNSVAGSPTGSVAFYACQTGTTQTQSDSYCTASGTPEATESLTAAANYTSTATSSSFTPSSPGTWCFSAVYGGDSNYSSSSDNTTASNLDSNECTFVSAVAPAITTQPQSQTVPVGDNATFSAAASGDPTPTVQWQVSTNGGTSFSNIGGATSTSYSTVSSLASSDYEYRAVFTNFGGSATTQAAGLAAEGGAVTVNKTTSLIGNEAVNVSGSSWNTNSDSTVEIYQCATLFYSASTCDHSTAQSATVETTPKSDVGKFATTSLTLSAGVIDSNGDTCGLSTSGTCYVVVQGSSHDSNYEALSFNLPTVTVKETSSVVGNYPNAVTAKDFPVGDVVTAQECDSSATASNVSTNCDSATEESGTADSSGTAMASSPAVDVTMLVNSAYSDTAGGTCSVGGTCEVVFVDTSNSAISFVVDVSMAIPTVSISPSSGASGTKVAVTATDFPSGDSVVAEQCDPHATASNISTNCDSSTKITGTAAASGTVSFSGAKITILTTTYSDSSSGTCAPGDTCRIAVYDSSNSGITATLVPFTITS